MKLLFVVFASAVALSAQDPQANPPVKTPEAKAAPKAAAISPAPVGSAIRVYYT